MPVSSAAPAAQPVSGHSRRRLRRALAALVGVAILLPATAGVDLPAASAASSCTGWTSTSVPPPTIRVGRASGAVETVDFRRYVGVVMAKEWPSWMPVAALEAGATAVKQYGWWYTLSGKHRSSYVSATGECFDVRDSTTDQLYKPEKVTVTDKIWRAVDATFGLSVRKSGKFFMTGYRAGTSSVCASDVDGTKLFAKSVMDCAQQGWSREQIQTTYYAPDVTFHWADSTVAPAPPPDVAAVAIAPPQVRLRAGTTLGQRHARVKWDHLGARPAGTTYELQRLRSGSWANVSLADPTKPSLDIALAWGHSHRFRVRLRDAGGDVGPWHTGPAFEARLAQDTKPAMSWSPGWQRVETTAASGGSVTYATGAESEMSFTLTARAAAVVGTLGPNRGVARIFVDGQLEAEVDLYAAQARWRVLIFAREWADSAPRTIRVVVAGTSGRPRVDIDGVLFYR